MCNFGSQAGFGSMPMPHWGKPSTDTDKPSTDTDKPSTDTDTSATATVTPSSDTSSDETVVVPADEDEIEDCDVCIKPPRCNRNLVINSVLANADADADICDEYDNDSCSGIGDLLGKLVSMLMQCLGLGSEQVDGDCDGSEIVIPINSKIGNIGDIYDNEGDISIPVGSNTGDISIPALGNTINSIGDISNSIGDINIPALGNNIVQPSISSPVVATPGSDCDDSQIVVPINSNIGNIGDIYGNAGDINIPVLGSNIVEPSISSPVVAAPGVGMTPVTNVQNVQAVNVAPTVTTQAVNVAPVAATQAVNVAPVAATQAVNVAPVAATVAPAAKAPAVDVDVDVALPRPRRGKPAAAAAAAAAASSGSGSAAAAAAAATAAHRRPPRRRPRRPHRPHPGSTAAAAAAAAAK